MTTTLDELFSTNYRTDQEKKCWALMCLDDNDNEFEIARFDSLEAAEVARKSFEARGHKQTYFLRRQ